MSRFNYSFIFVFLVTLLSFLEAQDVSKNNQYYQNIAINVVERTLNLMSREINSDSILFKIHKFVGEKLRSQDLRVEVSFDLNGVFEGGSLFSINDAGFPVIYFSPKLLDLYENNQSTVVSIIVHDLTDAYNYFTKKEYFLSRYNHVITALMFEADAYYVQSMFAAQILPIAFPRLNQFEQFLAEQYTSNGLGTLMLVLNGYHLNVVHYFYKLRDEWRSGLSKDLIQSSLVVNLRRSLEFTRDKRLTNNDWMNYVTISELLTIFELSLDLIKTIQGEPLTIEEFDRYLISTWPDVYEVVRQNLPLFIEKQSVWQNFRDQFYARFAESLR